MALGLVIALAPVWAPAIAGMASLPGWLSWLQPVASAVEGVSWQAAAIAGLGTSTLISSEGTADFVEKVGDGIGTVASSAGSAIGSATGGVLEGLFSSPYALAGAGLLIFLFLRRRNGNTA